VATLFAAAVAGWGLSAVQFSSWSGVGFTLGAGVLEAIYFVTLARAMEFGKFGLVYTGSRSGRRAGGQILLVASRF